jgi:flagellar protein FliS
LEIGEQGLPVNSIQQAAATAPMLPQDRAGSPHQMVSRLLEGALVRLDRARGEVRQGPSQSLAGAVAIVEALQDSLDLVHGGQLAGNLCDLYDYMLRRLAQARAAAAPEPITEVMSLLHTIREGWEAIAPEV